MERRPVRNLLRNIYNLVGIRGKILGIAVMLVLLLGTWFNLEVQSAHTATLRAQLERWGISVARDLAARSVDLIFTNNIFALHELVVDTLSNNEDIRYILIFNADYQPIIHTFGKGLPVGLRDANRVLAGERYRIRTLSTEEGIIHDIAVPIFDGRAGFVRLGLSEGTMLATVRQLSVRLWLTTLAVFIIAIGSAYWLAVLITNPIRELAGITEEVARGDLSRRVEPWLKDEIGRLGQSFNIMVDNLERSRQELEDKEMMRVNLLNQVITAQEEERKRIARELHDQTGQILASLSVGLKVLEDANDLAVVRNTTREMRQVLSQTQDGIRQLALELRPAVLDDLGLEAALARYARECSQKWGLEVDMHSTGLGGERLSTHVETAIYRIVQEALTNVFRHARAGNVSILLERRDAVLVAIVEDDGVGFIVEDALSRPLPERHLGLFGMAERAALIGGTLTIESSPGHGTTVYLAIPLSQEGGQAFGANHITTG